MLLAGLGNPEICQDPPSCGQDDQTLKTLTIKSGGIMKIETKIVLIMKVH